VLGQARQGAARARDCLALLRPFRTQLLVALGVGLGAGAAVFFAGPWAAAASGWLAGFGTSLAVQARHALKRVGALACTPPS
jgi:hypothetical protein